MKKFFLLCLSTFVSAWIFAQSSPPLIWHQDYGDPDYNQQVSKIAIDASDDLYVAGYVYFGNYGNVLVNKYDPFGNLLWNRQYSNDYLSSQSDESIGIFPDGGGGATVVGYVQRLHSFGHLYHYNLTGNVDADYFFGDTTLGNTIPVAVADNDSTGYYMFGLLNGLSKVFMCDNNGNIIWSQVLKNDYNPAKGRMQFDAEQNVVLGVFDSVMPQVVIHRFNKATGNEMQVFNTGIDSLPVDSVPIEILVDAAYNIFVAGIGTDTGGKLQLTVHKFDTLGNVLWSVQCPSAKGHIVPGEVLLRLDNSGNVFIDGNYADNNDSLQFVGVSKLDNSTGQVLWTSIDSGAFVKGGALQIDIYNNVYLGTLMAQTAGSDYSLLSFTDFSADNGAVIWNRSFDNSEDNSTIQMTLNSYGDVFFSCTTLADTLGGWFSGRVGNAAGDVEAILQTPSDTAYMKILPNPFSSTAHIAFSSQFDQEMHLKVFDMAGQLIDEKDLQAIEGNNLIAYKAAMAPGMYIFRLKSGNETLIQKAVVY